MPTIYLYARVSTNDQKYGIEVQRQFFKDNFPSECKSYELVEIEEKKSGKNIEDRKLENILNSLEKDDVIFVYDISRIGRNTEEVLQVARRIKNADARLRIALKYYDPDDCAEELQYSLQASIATYQRKVQNAKSRAGIAVKKEKGEWVYTGKLFGYQRNGNKITIDSNEARIVKYVFEQYSVGKSLNKIANDLNDSNEYPDKVFTATFISRMLFRPSYCGLQLIAGPGPRKNINKKHIKQENLVQSKIYPKIIDEDLFFLCQESFRNIKRTHAVQFQHRYASYQLSSILRCGYCGAGYVHCFSKSPKKIIKYYSCRVHKKACSQKFHSFQELILERLFRFAFITFISCPSDLMIYYKDKESEQKKQNEKLSNKKILLKNKLDEIDKEIDNAVKELLEPDNNSTIKTRIREKANNLEREKETLRNQIFLIDEQIQSSDNWQYYYKRSKKLWDSYKNSNDDKKRDIYIEFIKSAIIKDGMIQIEFITGHTVRIGLGARKGKYVQKRFDVFVTESKFCEYQYEINVDTMECNISYDGSYEDAVRAKMIWDEDVSTYEN